MISRTAEVGPVASSHYPKANSVRDSAGAGTALTPLLFAVSDWKSQRPHRARIQKESK